MEKPKKKLSLNKLTVSQLDKPDFVVGGDYGTWDKTSWTTFTTGATVFTSIIAGCSLTVNQCQYC